ncbi:MAG: AAA family ATPase [Solirubrobacteraceae bacterium]
MAIARPPRPEIRIAADPAEVAGAIGRLHAADGHGASVQMRETHISWVFLAGERAYKLKKPLVLDFVDYGTAVRRAEMCREEMRLNRRLAPHLYLGVRSIVRSGEGLQITDDDDPAAIDHLVEMKRYDEDQTLASALGRDQVAAAELVKLAETLARFHLDSAVAIEPHGAARVRREIEHNLAELTHEQPADEDQNRVDRVGRFLRAFVRGHAAALDERGARGAVREGHGDLRAEHVVLRPVLSVVDCVEFDAQLRTIDVADDLAFLLMDLALRDAEGAARALIDAYRGAGGDCGDDALLWFYAAHRALVRTKVALVRARQTATTTADSPAVASARALLALAERLVWRARGPLVLILCGLPASGKSHVAAELAGTARVPVISSDVTRKEIAGVPVRSRAPAAAYTPSFSERTYAELADRTARALGDAPCVLVDATFRHRRDRESFARRLGAGRPAIFVECLAPQSVRDERARAREHDTARISDATAEVVAATHGSWEPLDEVPAETHVVLRTDRPVQIVIDELIALLDERLSAGRKHRSAASGQ